MYRMCMRMKDKRGGRKKWKMRRGIEERDGERRSGRAESRMEKEKEGKRKKKGGWRMEERK